MSTTTYAFSGGTLIVAAAGTALFVANAVNYERARKNCNAISSGTANLLFWLNAILAVVFGLLFIWALFVLITHPRGKGETTTKTTITTGPPVAGVATSGNFSANVAPVVAPATHVIY